MGKIQLFIASSLDGYIARSSGDIDWLFTDQDYGYTDFLAQIDTVLMGRKTYEQVLSFGGEYPYKNKKSFVFSRSHQGKRNGKPDQPDEKIEFVDGSNIQSFIETLRRSSDRNSWLVGGSELIHSFMHYGLIDELILSIHPIILGSGIPLFVNDPALETKLKLTNVKSFDSGLLQVFYTLI